MKIKINILHSIKGKLIGVMLLSVLVPVLVVTILNFTTAVSTAERNMETLNVAQAKLVAQNFSEIINTNKHVLDTIAVSVSARKVLLGELDKESVADWMAKTDEKVGDGNACIFADADGQQIIRNKGDCVNVADRDYFIKCKTTLAFAASDVNVSKSTGARILTFIEPIFDLDGNFIGTIQRNYDADTLHEILKGEVTEVGMEIVACDNNGAVIAHSGHEVDPNSEESYETEKFFTNSRAVSSASYDTTKNGINYYVTFYKEPTTGWVIAVSRDKSVMMGEAYKSAIISIIVSLVLLIIVGLIAFFMSRYFSRPIFDTTAIVEKMSNGTFVNVSGYDKRKDEFGMIAKNINNLSETINKISGDIKERANTVNIAAESVAGKVENLTQVSTDVATAIDNVSQGAVSQADEVEHATQRSTNVQNSMTEINSLVANLAATSQQMSQINKSVVATLATLITSAERNQNAISTVTNNVSETSKAVDEISVAAEAIKGIASQTNLLSLNASIEAARAGEAGKGFAVVADEIRKLSEESNASAGQIAEILKRLIDTSKQTLESAQLVDASTAEQNKLLKDTESAMDNLSESVNSVSDMADSTATQIDSVMSDVAAVSDVLSNLSAITQENAASAEETNASVEEMAATLSTITGETEELKALADEVNSAVSFFKEAG